MRFWLILVAAAATLARPADRRETAPPPRPVREQAPPPQVALAPPGPPSAAGRALTAIGYVEVPMTRAVGQDGFGGAFYLTIRVNDRPVRVILDTGAVHTSLDKAVVRALGLTSRHTTKTGSGIGGSEIETGVTDPVELSVGGLATQAQLGVIDFSHVNVGTDRAGMPPTQGVLGDSFLALFAGVVDYSGSRLYLLPPYRQAPPELVGAWRCVREEQNGRAGPNPGRWRLDVAPGVVRLTEDDVTYTCQPQYGTSATPKEIDLRFVFSGQTAGYSGIFAVENRRLKLCLWTDGEVKTTRPKTFAAPAGSGYVLLEFEPELPGGGK